MKFNKKGQSVLDNFGSLAIGVGTLCIILVVAFLIMAQANTNMRSDNSACWNSSYSYNASSTRCCDTAGTCNSAFSLAYNSTGVLQNATATIPGWVSIIIITAIGAALIGMVAMFRS